MWQPEQGQTNWKAMEGVGTQGSQPPSQNVLDCAATEWKLNRKHPDDAEWAEYMDSVRPYYQALADTSPNEAKDILRSAHEYFQSTRPEAVMARKAQEFEELSRSLFSALDTYIGAALDGTVTKPLPAVAENLKLVMQSVAYTPQSVKNHPESKAVSQARAIMAQVLADNPKPSAMAQLSEAVIDAYRELETRGRQRDYHESSPLAAKEFNPQQLKAAAVMVMAGGVIMGQLAMNIPSINQAPAPRGDRPAIVSAEFIGPRATEQPIVKLANYSKAAPQTPAEAAGYGRTLMHAGATAAAKNETSKAASGSPSGNLIAVKVMDAIADTSIKSFMANNAIPLTPENMKLAAEVIANYKTAARYPDTIAESLSDNAPKYDDRAKAFEQMIFGGVHTSYTSSQKKLLASMTAQTMELLVSPDAVEQ
ncbi:MAG: hypothetical protein ABIV43_00200, partial [Candidatus Saccharimonadales bacterium]